MPVPFCTPYQPCSQYCPLCPFSHQVDQLATRVAQKPPHHPPSTIHRPPLSAVCRPSFGPRKARSPTSHQDSLWLPAARTLHFEQTTTKFGHPKRDTQQQTAIGPPPPSPDPLLRTFGTQIEFHILFPHHQLHPNRFSCCSLRHPPLTATNHFIARALQHEPPPATSRLIRSVTETHVARHLVERVPP